MADQRNFDREDTTLFDDENTTFDNGSKTVLLNDNQQPFNDPYNQPYNQPFNQPFEQQAPEGPEAQNQAEKPKSSNMGIKIAAAAAGGVVLGTGAVMGANLIIDDHKGEQGETPTTGEDVVTVEPAIEIAHGVNDDMSFSEAFASARAEVGPGGAFVWHGNVYVTYTEEEWAALTPEERGNVTDQLLGNDIAHHDVPTATAPEHHEDAHPVTEAPATDQHEVEDVAQVTPEEHEPQSVSGHVEVEAEPEVEVVHEVAQVDVEVEDDVDVEILGVVHDNETGMNFGAMVVDDQDIVLIDVDGDEVFDFAASDINGDGELQDNEILDISSDYLTVEDLGGYINDPYSDIDGATDDLAYDPGMDM